MSEEMFRGVNVFERYHQIENQFTKGLLALIELSTAQDPQFPKRFIEKLLPEIEIKGGIKSFRVLKDYDKTKDRQGKDVETWDAEIIAEDVFLAFETKINSYTLEQKQIRHHLDLLAKRAERTKTLVLLTPDDGKSRFIEDLLCIRPEFLLHLRWKEIYEYLQEQREPWKGLVFGTLIEQYLAFIQQRVFEQDHVGYIMKMAFNNRTELTPDNYIEEITKKDASWGLSKKKKELQTPGRRLLLFDPSRQEITVEMEIERTEEREDNGEFRFCNVIRRGSQMSFRPPIPVTRIVQCGRKLVNFKKKGAQAPYWLLLASQYDQLTASAEKVPLPLDKEQETVPVGTRSNVEAELLDRP